MTKGNKNLSETQNLLNVLFLFGLHPKTKNKKQKSSIHGQFQVDEMKISSPLVNVASPSKSLSISLFYAYIYSISFIGIYFHIIKMRYWSN